MGQIIRKDATITPTGTDDDFPGTFQVILSAPTKDRDGETLLPGEWKQPLPDHITFDRDHAMTVEGTIGSGTPHLDEDTGNLIVDGTYSSLPKAQEVRTLVNEGHIRTTSVAFMSEKSSKDGVTAVTRELLNGAFVAIPSNREALVLSSKALKAGARNSKSDADGIQSIHDNAVSLGAACGAEKSAGMSKVFTKDADADPMAMVAAVDAALGDAGALLVGIDITTLPPEVQQALALVTAAETSVDALMDVLGISDPDDEDDGEPTDPNVNPADGTAKAATPAGSPSGDRIEDSEELEAMKKRALAFRLRAKI